MKTPLPPCPPSQVPPTPRRQLSQFPVSPKKHSMCVKASICCYFSPCCVPLSFYTWLPSNKRSNCSWLPARVPVAFVISVHAEPGFPLPASRAFCGLSATCILRAALTPRLVGGGRSVVRLPGPLSANTDSCSALRPQCPPAELNQKPTFYNRIPFPDSLPCPYMCFLGLGFR